MLKRRKAETSNDNVGWRYFEQERLHPEVGLVLRFERRIMSRLHECQDQDISILRFN